MSSTATQRDGSKRWLIAGVVAVLVVGAGALAVWRSSQLVDPASVVPTYVVEKGPLVISLTETGTIRARDQVVIKSEVEGRATIISLVDEGTLVSKGDLLVQLDASGFEVEKAEQEIKVENAKAAWVRAREELEVTINQGKSDVSQAELDARFAAEDLEIYRTGEYPKELKELEVKINIAREELQRAEDRAEGSRRLAEEKYISQSELLADELSATKARLDVELAEADLDLFKKHTHPRKIEELAAEKQQAEMALVRERLKASADEIKDQADVTAKKAEFDQTKARLMRIDDQIKKATIRAPQDGLVVYATSTRFSWRGNDEPLAEGQEVRERQELILLPATDAMMADVQIPESRLEVVALGMPVTITVDAIPDQRFTGRVTRIAPLPDPRSVFMNPGLKVYDTDVMFDQTHPSMRTGMGCTVEIVAEQHPEAMYVPIQAVVRNGNQPTVYRKRGDVFEAHAISIGLDNNQLVHVTDGLAPGDIVSLTPPLETGSVELAAESAEPQAPAVPQGPGRDRTEKPDGPKLSGQPKTATPVEETGS